MINFDNNNVYFNKREIGELLPTNICGRVEWKFMPTGNWMFTPDELFVIMKRLIELQAMENTVVYK